MARDCKAARLLLAVAEPGDSGNPVISQVVLATIAYVDAFTARAAGTVNQQDHAAAVKALRDALGNRLPRAEETRVRAILSLKDQVQYGARRSTLDDARKQVESLDAFAAWADAELAR